MRLADRLDMVRLSSRQAHWISRAPSIKIVTCGPFPRKLLLIIGETISNKALRDAKKVTEGIVSRKRFDCT